MSFRCAVCGKARRDGSLVVRETREKDYMEVRYDRGHEVVVQAGHGHETVREEMVCRECQDHEARRAERAA